MNRRQRESTSKSDSTGVNTDPSTNKESKSMSTATASASPDDPGYYVTKDGQRRARPGTNIGLIWDIFVAFRDQPISVTDAVSLLSEYGITDPMRVSGMMQSFSWPNAHHYQPGHRLKPAAHTAAGVMGKAPGHVYRTQRGVYVYDTQCRIFRGKLVDNSWACWAGKGHVIPASPPMPERQQLPQAEAEVEPFGVEPGTVTQIPNLLEARLAQLQAMQPAQLKPEAPLDPSVAYGPDDVSRQMAELRAEREAEAEAHEAGIEARREAEAGPTNLDPTYVVEFLLHETSPDGEERVYELETLDLGEQPSLVAAIQAWIFVRDSR